MAELAQSAKESDDRQLNSMEVVGGSRVINAPSEVFSVKQSGTLNDTIEISRNNLTNFEDLSAHINSKQLSLGNFFKPSTNNQPETQLSYINQNPLNKHLVLTPLNTITPMETESPNKTNQSIPITNQPP